MVNFGNPSTNSVPHQLRYNRHEASQKPQPPSEYPTIGNFFQRDFPTTSISTNKHTNRSISLRSTFRWKPRWKILLYKPISSSELKFTCRKVSALEALFGNGPPSTGSSIASKRAQPLHAPHRCRKSPHFPLFRSSDYFCAILSPKSSLFCVF